jgi:molecular chaperone DnaK (HSP70)
MFPLLGNTALLLKTRVRVVGIDLGTTNSTVAEITFDGGETTPSIRCINVD